MKQDVTRSVPSKQATISLGGGGVSGISRRPNYLLQLGNCVRKQFAGKVVVVRRSSFVLVVGVIVVALILGFYLILSQELVTGKPLFLLSRAGVTLTLL